MQFWVSSITFLLSIGEFARIKASPYSSQYVAVLLFGNVNWNSQVGRCLQVGHIAGTLNVQLMCRTEQLHLPATMVMT